MTTLREAAQQALEALRVANAALGHPDNIAIMESAISALRAALAEPVQEPVAEARYDRTLRWLEPRGVMSGGSMNYLYSKVLHQSDFPLDTPEREAFAAHLKLVAQALHDIEWVDSGDYGPGDENAAIRACLSQRKPLTREEIMDLCASQWAAHPVEVARLIEQAHGIGTERPATLTKPCGSLGEDVSLCRYPDCAGGQAGTICNNWCPGARK